MADNRTNYVKSDPDVHAPVCRVQLCSACTQPTLSGAGKEYWPRRFCLQNLCALETTTSTAPVQRRGKGLGWTVKRWRS